MEAERVDTEQIVIWPIVVDKMEPGIQIAERAVRKKNNNLITRTLITTPTQVTGGAFGATN